MAKKKNRQERRAEQHRNSQSNTIAKGTNQNRRLQQTINAAFSLTESDVKSACREYGSSLSDFDFDSIKLKRRKAATERVILSAKENLREAYDSLSEIIDVEQWLIHLSAQPILPYDYVEMRQIVSPAVAIWMLDQIKAAGKMEELLAILPRDEIILDAATLPNIWDTSHETAVLQGTLAVLLYRHLQCSMDPNELTPLHLNHIEKFCFTDEWNASGVNHQAVPTRNKFDELLRLIPNDVIDRAVSKCSALLWKWYEMVLNCHTVFAVHKADLENQEALLDDEFTALIEQNNESFDKRMNLPSDLVSKIHTQKDDPKSISDTSLIPSAINTTSATQQAIYKPNSLQNTSAFFSRGFQISLDMIIEKQNLLKQQKDELCQQEASFQGLLSTYSIDLEIFDPYSFGEEIGDLFSSFTIEDPYETCFALFYMLDQNFDIAWNYFAGVCVFAKAAACLPWANSPPLDPDSLESFSDLLAQKGSIRSSDIPEIPDFYKPLYSDYEWGNNSNKKINLAQIIYRLTGTILPRDINNSYSYLSELSKYGIRGKKLTLPLICMLAITNSAKTQSRIDWRYELNDYDNDIEAPELFESPQTPISNEVTNLKREVDRLRKALHDADKEVRDTRKELENREKLAETQRLELADLRSIVFNQENLQEGPEAVETEYSALFPYQVKRRTLIFGGHDSWLREIKPRLSDARFVGKDAVPDLNLIRNADVIWVQTNCISHKQYYRMMDVARTRSITVRYFTFSSAMKCALQIIEYDQKG